MGKRVTEEKAIQEIVGSTYCVGGMIYTHRHCLNVYSKFCDDYSIEPDADIHNKTAEEIFTECHRIYNENN